MRQSFLSKSLSIMLSTSKIRYSNGYINSGAIVVDPQHSGKTLQIRAKGTEYWSDVGKVMSNGMAGFKSAFRIDSPDIEVRIFNGPFLGSISLEPKIKPNRPASVSSPPKKQTAYQPKEKKKSKLWKFIKWVGIILLFLFILSNL